MQHTPGSYHQMSLSSHSPTPALHKSVVLYNLCAHLFLTKTCFYISYILFIFYWILVVEICAGILLCIKLFLDHTTAKMVSQEAWIQSQGSPCGILVHKMVQHQV
jgi:hypothetical protein